MAAVGLNWATTGDHLIKTVFTDTYWPVAGVDLSLLAVAALGAWAAGKLARRQHGVQNLPSSTGAKGNAEVAHA